MFALRGRGRFYCLRPNGSVRPDSVREQSNMITDAGLDGIATVSIHSLSQYAGVGTNATLPATNQTSLFTPVAIGGVMRTNTGHTNNQVSFMEGDYAVYRRAFKFPAATADMILREWGFFSASASGIMWNREVFRATVDNTPTDYPLLTGEELVMELDIMMKVPTADVPVGWNIATNDPTNPNIATTGVVRASGATSTNVWHTGNFGPSVWNTTLGAVVLNTGLEPRQNFVSSGNAASTTSLAAYTAGSRYIDVTYIWEPANFTQTVNRIMVGYSANGNSSCRYQLSVVPGVAKTSAKRFRQPIRFSWGRE